MSDLAVSPTRNVEAWVRKTIGSRAPLRFEALTGATSSSVYSVLVGDLPAFVLRMFTNRDWLGREPDLAEHEAAALTHAARAGIPAPKLVGHASAAESGIPTVLMTHAPRRRDLPP